MVCRRASHTTTTCPRHSVLSRQVYCTANNFDHVPTAIFARNLMYLSGPSGEPRTATSRISVLFEIGRRGRRRVCKRLQQIVMKKKLNCKQNNPAVLPPSASRLPDNCLNQSVRRKRSRQNSIGDGCTLLLFKTIRGFSSPKGFSKNCDGAAALSELRHLHSRRTAKKK